MSTLKLEKSSFLQLEGGELPIPLKSALAKIQKHRSQKEAIETRNQGGNV